MRPSDSLYRIRCRRGHRLASRQAALRQDLRSIAEGILQVSVSPSRRREMGAFHPRCRTAFALHDERRIPAYLGAQHPRRRAAPILDHIPDHESRNGGEPIEAERSDLSGLLLIGIILQFYQRIFGRRRRARRYARFLRAAILREFYCRNGPPSGVAFDGNSQPVGFVKRDSFNRPRFSVAEDYGFADKFDLGVMERAE